MFQFTIGSAAVGGFLIRLHCGFIVLATLSTFNTSKIDPNWREREKFRRQFILLSSMPSANELINYCQLNWSVHELKANHFSCNGIKTDSTLFFKFKSARFGPLIGLWNLHFRMKYSVYQFNSINHCWLVSSRRSSSSRRCHTPKCVFTNRSHFEMCDTMKNATLDKSNRSSFTRRMEQTDISANSLLALLSAVSQLTQYGSFNCTSSWKKNGGNQLWLKLAKWCF